MPPSTKTQGSLVYTCTFTLQSNAKLFSKVVFNNSDPFQQYSSLHHLLANT